MIAEESPKLCHLAMYFQTPAGLLCASRLLAGGVMDLEPKEFARHLLRQLGCALGGKLLNVPVYTIGLSLTGIPTALHKLLESHLPVSPRAANAVCDQYLWDGPTQPPQSEKLTNGEQA